MAVESQLKYRLRAEAHLLRHHFFALFLVVAELTGGGG